MFWTFNAREIFSWSRRDGGGGGKLCGPLLLRILQVLCLSSQGGRVVWAREQGSQREGCYMRAHPPLPHLLSAKRTLRLGVRQWSVEMNPQLSIIGDSSIIRQFICCSIFSILFYRCTHKHCYRFTRFIAIIFGFRLDKSKHLKENHQMIDLKKLCLY